MGRTIEECWMCRYHCDDNLYGIDYCERHETRCSFVSDECDYYDDVTADEQLSRAVWRGLMLVWCYLSALIAAIVVCGVVHYCAK